MVGWHHQLNRHEFEQASGVGDGDLAWHAVVHAACPKVRHDWATELIEWMNKYREKDKDDTDIDCD